MSLSTHEINKRSIAFVERRLFALGIGPMEHPSVPGIHLISRSKLGHEIKIQVKGTGEPQPGGGKGKLALAWRVAANNPADVIALVDLHSERIWLLTLEEVGETAEQFANGRYNLYMYVDPTVNLRRGMLDTDFEEHLLERKAPQLLLL